MKSSIFKENKKLLALGIVIFVIAAIALSFTYGAKQVPGTTTNTPPTNEPELGTPITREERISHIAWSYTNGKKYKEYDFGGGEALVVTFYQWKSEKEDEHEGGLLVFKIENNKPELIWESNEDITSTIPLIKTEDLTADGKKELLALWQDGKNETLYIYQSQNDKFVLITPLIQPWTHYGSYAKTPAFAAPDSQIQITDLDNDHIPEIWFPTQLNDAGEIVDEYYVAYKWNGSKYILWKTQKTPFAQYQPFLN